MSKIYNKVVRAFREGNIDRANELFLIGARVQDVKQSSIRRFKQYQGNLSDDEFNTKMLKRNWRFHTPKEGRLRKFYHTRGKANDVHTLTCYLRSMLEGDLTRIYPEVEGFNEFLFVSTLALSGNLLVGYENLKDLTEEKYEPDPNIDVFRELCLIALKPIMAKAVTQLCLISSELEGDSINDFALYYFFNLVKHFETYRLGFIEESDKRELMMAKIRLGQRILSGETQYNNFLKSL